ncbi:(Fe-S)-binding protein [Planctomycetota bacterium]
MVVLRRYRCWSNQSPRLTPGLRLSPRRACAHSATQQRWTCYAKSLSKTLTDERPEYASKPACGRRCMRAPACSSSKLRKRKPATVPETREQTLPETDGEAGTEAPIKTPRPMTAMDIFKLLPRTNCGKCGQPTCLALAALIGKGDSIPEDCPDISDAARRQLLRALKVGKVGGEVG